MDLCALLPFAAEVHDNDDNDYDADEYDYDDDDANHKLLAIVTAIVRWLTEDILSKSINHALIVPDEESNCSHRLRALNAIESD